MRAELKDKISTGAAEKVNLAGMNIQDDEVRDIIAEIKRVKSGVTKIDLDNNNIKDAGVSALIEALTEHDLHLGELSIQFNKISREGAIVLFGLKASHRVSDILFRGNGITDEGVMAEVERLAGCVRELRIG